jgi:hypothetical protein
VAGTRRLGGDMKKLILPLLSLTCMFAQADVVLEQKVEATTNNGSMLTRIKGDIARIDMPALQVGEISMLINLKEGQITTLVHGKKVFVTETIENSKKKTEAQLKENGIDLSKDEVPKATGQKEKVGEWDTEIFEGVITGNKTKYWIAKDFPNYKPLTEQMSRFIVAMGGGSFDPSKHDLGGMIVKSETTLPKDKGKVTKTVIKAKEEAVDDAVFKAPEGYEAIKVPAQ